MDDEDNVLGRIVVISNTPERVEEVREEFPRELQLELVTYKQPPVPAKRRRIVKRMVN